MSDFSERVRVLGPINGARLVAAYQAADVFIFPSISDGFGLVLLEALACGLPVITTPRTAGPDLITQGENGFLVDAGDATALASRIQWFLENRSRIPSMSAAARATALTFSWVKFRSRISEILNQIAEDRGATSPERIQAFSRGSSLQHGPGVSWRM